MQPRDLELRKPVHLAVVVVPGEPVFVADHEGLLPAGPAPVPFALQHLRAAALQQGNALAIDVRAGDSRRATDHDAVGASRAPATTVERGEEVIPIAALRDGRRFDALALPRCQRDGRVVAQPQPRLRVERDQADAVPPRAEDQPAAVMVIEAEAVDGVEVAALVAADDESLVPPALRRRRGIEGVVDHEADEAVLVPEARGRVIEVGAAVADRDRGRPDVAGIVAEFGFDPGRDAAGERARIVPGEAVG